MRAKRILSAPALAACLLATNVVDVFAQGAGQQKRTATVIAAQDEIVLAPAPAQEGQERRAATVISTQEGTAVATTVGHPDNTFVFLSTEMAISGKTVKGAPYSAEAVTETTQILGDGNRIVRRNTAQVYRDSEGRTRRDQTIAVLGPFAHQGDPPQTIVINDPVAGTNYVLDPRTKTARKMLVRTFVAGEAEAKVRTELKAAQKVLGETRAEGKGESKAEAKAEGKAQTYVRRPGVEAGGFTYTTQAHGGGGPDVVFYRSGPEQPAKTESLGTEMVEGVKAEGTRTTITIPAGSIGNERDINIVSERWYSPELQTVVKTVHSDPRLGETVYRLTNINRSEPAPSLFQLPTDYTVKEGPAAFGGGTTFRKLKPTEQKENFYFELQARPEQN